MNKIEIIAKFLEDFAIELDRDNEIAPSLDRLPKDQNSWENFISDAKKLQRHLNH